MLSKIIMIFLCWCNYSGENDACDVTLSVYPHRAVSEQNLQSLPETMGQLL
jgi:hypothetical protein